MRWSKTAAQFRSPAFVRCLYDYLNEMDVKNVDWKSERRSCLTKSYYDMIILNTPNEPFCILKPCIIKYAHEILIGRTCLQLRFLKH